MLADDAAAGGTSDGETDPAEMEYRKWDQVSDPPDPDETLASWDEGTRDRVVAVLTLVVLGVFGVVLLDPVGFSPVLAVVYGLGGLAFAALSVPAVRDRIPRVNAVRSVLVVAFIAGLLAIRGSGLGHVAGFVAFVLVLSAGFALARRLSG